MSDFHFHRRLTETIVKTFFTKFFLIVELVKEKFGIELLDLLPVSKLLPPMFHP